MSLNSLALFLVFDACACQMSQEPPQGPARLTVMPTLFGGNKGCIDCTHPASIIARLLWTTILQKPLTAT